MTIEARRQDFYRSVLTAAVARLGRAVKVPQVGMRGSQQFRSGEFGSYWIWFAREGLRVVAYLDHKGGDADVNRALLATITPLLGKVESATGHRVTVDVEEGRRAVWAGLVRGPVDLDDPQETAAAMSWAADAVVALVGILDRHLRAGALDLTPDTPSARTEPPVDAVAAGPVIATDAESPASAAAPTADPWAPLRDELPKAVTAIAAGQTGAFLILSVQGTAEEIEPGQWSATKVVQIWLGADSVRAETTGDLFLIGRHKLTPNQLDTLRRLGYTAPDGDPQRPGARTNHFADFPTPAPADAIAALLIDTLIQVHGLADPSTVTYSAGLADGGYIALPYLPLAMDASSPLRKDGSPAVRAGLERILAVVTRREDIRFDSAGQHWIFVEEAPIITRYIDGNPGLVRITTNLLRSVAAHADLLAAVNDLNIQSDMVKVLLIDGSVIAAADLSAVCCDSDLFSHVAFSVASASNGHAAGLQERFGGARPFEENPAPAQASESLPGYL